MSKKAVETCISIAKVIEAYRSGKTICRGVNIPTAHTPEVDLLLGTIMEHVREVMDQTIPSAPIALTRETADQIALALLRDLETQKFQAIALMLSEGERYDLRLAWTDKIVAMAIPVPGLMIVRSDNFDKSGETPGRDETAIAVGIKHQSDADVIADALNRLEPGEQSEWHYEVRPSDYVLREFRP
jgi:hypothetical protein